MSSELYNPFTDMRGRGIFSPKKPKQPDFFAPRSGYEPAEAQETDENPFAINLPKQPEKRVYWGGSQESADTTEDNDVENYFKQYQDIHTKAQGAPLRSAYVKTLGEQPQAADYAPSKMRRFGGAIAGIAGGLSGGAEQGVRTAREFTDAPYDTAVRDWAARAGGQEKAAKLEQEDFENQAKVLEHGMNFGLNRRKVAREEAAQRSTEELNRKRGGYYDAQAEHLRSPEWEKIEEANGDLLMVNKKNPLENYRLDADTAAGLRARASGVSAEASMSRAGAAHRQAGVGERGNELEAEEMDRRQGRFIAGENAANWRASRTSPNEQTDARRSVLAEMAQQSGFADFIGSEKIGGVDVPKFKDNVNTASPTYRKFVEEFNKRFQLATEGGGIGGGLPMPEDPAARFRVVK